MERDLLKTTLYAKHAALGAKFTHFAGYIMPLKYTRGELAEHRHVRQDVGVFDVSHMGELFIRGKDATSFCQYVTSNDVTKLTPGMVQYTVIMNATGGAVDDVTLYRLDHDQYMFCVNAANRKKVLIHLSDLARNFNITIDDQSDLWNLLAVQGPRSELLIQEIVDIDLHQLRFFRFMPTPINGITVWLSRTGYTGEKGFELFIPENRSEAIWELLFQVGAAYNLAPIGLGARDTLRLEMGYILYGNDLTDAISPIEAGLGWAVQKGGTPFLGSDIISAHRQGKVKQRLIALKLSERGVPRPGYPVYNQQGDKVGTVTSGSISPTLGVGIALAYIRPDDYALNTPYWIGIRTQKKQARSLKLPFINKR